MRPSPPPPRPTSHHRGIPKEHEELWEDYPFIRLSWQMKPVQSYISEITEKIERYLRAESINELYSCALEHLEQLQGEAMVRDIFRALWKAGERISLHDLAVASRWQLESVEQVIGAVSNHLVWHAEGVVLSEPLRTAVAQRYLLTATGPSTP